MAFTAFWYINAFEAAFNKEIDFLTDDIAVSLHTVTYVPNQDTHDYFNDLTNQLATANGYTAEDGAGAGFSLAGKTHANTLNVSTFDATDPQWTSSGAGFTARIAVVTDVTPGTAATDPLLMWMDFGQNETASGGGTFTIALHATGLATLTAVDATGFP